MKECSDVTVTDTEFLLRYPLWHSKNVVIDSCSFTESCRAGMWYTYNLRIKSSKLYGIKAIREAVNTEIYYCDIISPEFGWKCKNLKLYNSKIESEYLFLDSSDIVIENMDYKGKYSFQYVKNAIIKNSVLDTKDAFWHTECVTVEDSIIRGQYLGWYSKNLRLIRCQISDTQPLCYCEGLELIDCTMKDTDLSFERSKVNAVVKGNIKSVKNPASGSIIKADNIDEIIFDEYGTPETVNIITNNK